MIGRAVSRRNLCVPVFFLYNYLSHWLSVFYGGHKVSHEFLLLLPAKKTALFSRGNIRRLPRDIFDYNIESRISLAVVDDIA